MAYSVPSYLKKAKNQTHTRLRLDLVMLRNPDFVCTFQARIVGNLRLLSV